MRTAKAQTSLLIGAVWSGPCCPLPESFDTIECMNGEQRPQGCLEHVHDNLNLHIFSWRGSQDNIDNFDQRSSLALKLAYQELSFSSLNVCMYVCVYIVCMYVCMRACVHACVCTCIHACIYVCMYLLIKKFRRRHFEIRDVLFVFRIFPIQQA